MEQEHVIHFVKSQLVNKGFSGRYYRSIKPIQTYSPSERA